jgi:hypothetical protein
MRDSETGHRRRNLLVVLSANPTNDIVSAIHDAARVLVRPFDGMFTLEGAGATLAVSGASLHLST